MLRDLYVYGSGVQTHLYYPTEGTRATVLLD